MRKVSQENWRSRSSGRVGISDSKAGTPVVSMAPIAWRSRSALAMRWLGRAIEMFVDSGTESIPWKVGSCDVMVAAAVSRRTAEIAPKTVSSSGEKTGDPLRS